MGEAAVCSEVLTNGINENNLGTELKHDRQCIVDDAEPDHFPNKKLAKEVSNEDIRSEVSNPVVSVNENASIMHDITSHSAELASRNKAGCGEVTSDLSEKSNSSTEETLSDGEHDRNDNDTSSDVQSKSHVVLEIPKHASTTGIRKITFKFSKKKDNCIDSGAHPVIDSHDKHQPHAGYYEASKLEFVEGDQHGLNLQGLSENGDPNNCAPDVKLKVSRRVALNNFPTNVKKLLSTGILDGARVKYISPTGEKQLPGVIDGGGYMCGCSACNYTTVLSAYEFEQHAGARTRHPNNHIYLENGKPVYSIIQELKTAPLSMLDEVMKEVAGSSINEEYFHAWKASFHRSNGMAVEERNHDIKSSGLSNSLLSECLEESVSPGSGSCSVLQNNAHKQQICKRESSEEQKNTVKRPMSYISDSAIKRKKSTGSGTKRRDNDLHRLLFMPNGLPDGAELAYYVKGQRILGGYKQGNGIVCGCCNREISPSQFEAHAGMAARRQPYRHIYTSNGLTLHDIALSLASGQNLTMGYSDDMCTVCGDGGDLIFCDGCPRAFHAACLNLQSSPESGWHCPDCKDKSVTGRKTVAGGSINAARPIKVRLTRVVRAAELEYGGCVFCRAHDFSAEGFNDRTVILCDQCEKEYHVGCLRENGMCDLKEISKDKWFCCDDCHKIYVALQNSVSSGAEMVPSSSLNAIIRKHAQRGSPIDGVVSDVQWKILSGRGRSPEDLRLLSRACAIFRECFDPIVTTSGRDLIPVMVYGRNISGQEFSGMYCVVLIVNSLVVSAGLLRIFGRGVAELPIVATSREHQGKGYFQALFSCIERLLHSLNVEKLVLPAAEEAFSIWTNKFGFRKINEEQYPQYMREVQLTVFSGTSMLEKEVQQIIE